MIKNHRLYKHYLCYLDYKKSHFRISEGAVKLMSISKSSFDDFVYDYENFEAFHIQVNDLYKESIRHDKINDILSDEID